jgi:hypothetical protein
LTVKIIQVNDKTFRTIKYSTVKNMKVKRPKPDIVIGPPGVIPEAKNLKDAASAFDYFFPVSLQKKVCSFTNKRIAASLRGLLASDSDR